ncbi:MAG: 5'-nucleotidase domain-containing protein, partial [Acidimicrobiia bacterium]
MNEPPVNGPPVSRPALDEPGRALDAPGAQARPAGVRRIYCNRSLRFDHVCAVGFDMDYTLAIYDQQQM